MHCSPHMKKKSVLGVSDGTVTEQLFHSLESTHFFFFLTDIPDDSCVCLQKDFNAM